MINGHYVFKSNDNFLASYKNVVTTNGYFMINKYLAYAAQDWAGSMAIGVLKRNNASASDTALEYEVARYPITLKSYRTVSGSNQILLKATIDPVLSGSITEIGIFPSNNIGRDHYVISDFSENSSGINLWTASGSTSSLEFAAYSRYGASNSYFRASSSYIVNSNISFDMSQYTYTDYADLLIYTPATSSGTFQISFADTVGNVWRSGSGTGSVSGAGYYSVKMPLSGSYSSNFNYLINSVSINFLTTSTSSIHFDALKLISGEVKPDILKLTSRSIFTIPISKNANEPMQIEYYVQVT